MGAVSFYEELYLKVCVFCVFFKGLLTLSDKRKPKQSKIWL